MPRSESPDNLRIAKQASDQFDAVLKQQPNDAETLRSVASLYLKQGRLQDAARVYRELSKLLPSSAEAYYLLGSIAWERFAPVYWSARAAAGARPEDPGPIPDASARTHLRAEWLPALDAAVSDLKRANELDPGNDEAMTCLSEVLRGRAGLAGSDAEFESTVRESADWAQRAAEGRLRKVERR